MQLTRNCDGCKNPFRKTELVQYASLSGKTKYWLCPQCLEEKIAREKFQIKVCQIFGLKSPGPMIWSQRKRLIDTYGYTDDVIVDCLDYIYNVEKKAKLKDSLGLVQPYMVERMRAWKSKQKAVASGIAAAIANTEMKEYVVPIKETKNIKKETSLEDGLFDD